MIALEVFLDQMYHAFCEDLAEKMTCHEAEATADLYRSVDRFSDAEAIIEAHSYGDEEPDDQHYRGIEA